MPIGIGMGLSPVFLGGVVVSTPDALLTEAGEEIITESGDVIIHEDTES